MPEPSRTSIERTEIQEHGQVRTVRGWHPNGTLVEEQRGRMLPDGRFVFDGQSKRWNSEGQLLGTFEFENGTGVQRDWYDGGQLIYENPMVDGLLTGLQRGWDESGYLLFERCWYRGSPTSKKRYRELQESDPLIPTYDEAEFRTVAQKRKEGGG